MLDGVLNTLILILYLIGWLLCQWQQLGWQVRDQHGFSQPQRLSHTWDEEKKTFAWPFFMTTMSKTIYKPCKLDLWVNNVLIFIIKIREIPSNNKIEHSVAMFALIKFFRGLKTRLSQTNLTFWHAFNLKSLTLGCCINVTDAHLQTKWGKILH